jgi:squalene-hopene/tetraprenyl-beta-curcumene cyclase
MQEIHSTVESTRKIVAEALQKGREYLFSVQRADGSWCDQLSSSAIATGTALVALFYADREQFASYLREGAQWLRKTQHADGSWGDAVIDAGTLNGTAIAVAALKLIDAEHSHAAIQRGLAFIEEQGGMDALADLSRCSLNELCFTLLALGDLCEWPRVLRMPSGVILLPQWLQRRVSFTLPAILSWGLWHAQSRPGGLFRRLINGWARPQALRWLRAIQEENGGIEEAPIMVATVIINLIHAQEGDDIVRRGVSYLCSTRRSDGSWAMDRDLEFSVTNMLVSAMDAIGESAEPRLQPTISWMLRSQQKRAFRATGCPAGGWAWGLPSGWPNTDDTGNALAALTCMGIPHTDPAIQKGQQWLLAMQNRDGSWACFVRNGFVRHRLVSFDESCPAFTAHAVIGLYLSGLERTHPALQRALRYFQRIQRADGAIHCLWYRNYTSGTAFVLEAYALLGLSDASVALQCRQWLLANQNEDGSWGGVRGQDGTVEETSWVLTALVKSGLSTTDERLERAACWLVSEQAEAGNWRPATIGLYYNSISYSSDHLANSAALKALGSFLS